MTFALNTEFVGKLDRIQGQTCAREFRGANYDFGMFIVESGVALCPAYVVS